MGPAMDSDSLGFSIQQSSSADPPMPAPQVIDDASLSITVNDENDDEPVCDIETGEHGPVTIPVPTLLNDDKEDEPVNDIEPNENGPGTIPVPATSNDDKEDEAGNDVENGENGPVTIPQSLLHGIHLHPAPSTANALANHYVDASDADTTAIFSFEVRPQDDISTLADTVAESSDGVHYVLPPVLNIYAHQAVPMDIPLRHFVSESKGMGGQGRTIQLVPTEDTSHGSPKDQSKLDIEEVKQSPQMNVRRMIFWVSLIMTPIILITLIVLAVMLIRLRQDQGLSSTTSAGQASTQTESEGLNGTFPFTDLTISPSLPPLANEFTSPPTLMPTSQSMTNWSSESPSTSPTESSTEIPTESPTDNPTGSPTQSPTLSPTISTVTGVTLSPTPGLTKALTPSPTGQATSADTVTPTISSTNSQTIDGTEITEPVAQPPFPNLRFVPWGQFTSSADSGLRSAVINSLGYDQSGWNRPGTASIESSTYQDVVQQGTSFSTPLEILGFDTSTVWNCWINHYFDFNWDDLTRLPSEAEAIGGQDLVSSSTSYGQQVQEAWQTLGWTSSSWSSSNSADWPSSQSKSWIELTAAERQAAQVLCYNQELWDEIPIPRW